MVASLLVLLLLLFLPFPLHRLAVALQCSQCSGDDDCLFPTDVVRCLTGHFCYTLTNMNTQRDEEKGCAGNCDFAFTQQQLCFPCHDDLCNERGPLRCGYCEGEVDCYGSTRVVSCPASLPGCYTIRNATNAVTMRKGCALGCTEDNEKERCLFCQEDLCNHLTKRDEPSSP